MVKEIKRDLLDKTLVSDLKTKGRQVSFYYRVNSIKEDGDISYDYVGTLTFKWFGYEYILKGHGIGQNKAIYFSASKLIENIKKDHKRFSVNEVVLMSE